jgi:hypothetical protein
MNALLTILLLTLSSLSTAALAGPPSLILAQQVQLSQPHAYLWTAEQPQITRATVVVVSVDSEDAQVRQVGGPVLYVGAVPAERLNNGDIDGAIIAFVPGHIDLSQTPIFWGPPTLPERSSPSEREAALQQTVAQPTEAGRLTARTLQPIHLKDTAGLYQYLADFIDTYAPGEHERAQAYRGERP